MIFQLLFVLLGVAAVVAANGFDKGQVYSVVCHEKHSGDCELKPGKFAYGGKTHAFGTYTDDVMTDGWGKLWVHGDDTVEGWFQAGFLEGALTSLRIYQHFTSWYDYQFGTKPVTENTVKFMYEQYAYAKTLVSNPEKRTDTASDEYYNTLEKLLAQFEGLVAGVNYGAADPSQQLTVLQLLLLEAAGDLYDIIPAVDPQAERLQVGKMSALEFFDKWHERISCSAVIKIPDDFSDIYAGHTSWTTYQSMLRIYKQYDLDNGRYRSSHSSKPGLLYSKDDFYVLPRTQMVVIETTNGVLNSDLYKFVTPRSLLTWQRLPIANTLAENSPDWANMLKPYNSGTYANQWMALDLKRFAQIQAARRQGTVDDGHDLLWIIELAPNVAVAQDVSGVLLTGRDGDKNFNWPSYNVPYDKQVYTITGFQKAYETYGDSYSYTNCTRGQMFTRDTPAVQTFSDVQHILRYNDYTKDPLSQGNAASAISARYDLRTDSPKTYGGVDTKVSSFSRVMGTAGNVALVSAQVGPTHDNIAPFQWSTSGFDSQVHLGQPDLFNFGFVEMDYYQH